MIKTERRSGSIIGRKPSKTDVVEANVGGGGALVVDARRRSVLAKSMSRKSYAEKVGVFRGRDGRPRRPEIEDQRRFGLFISAVQ